MTATASERLIFPGATGADLAGRLDRPTGTPRAFALFAHCFTCTKDTLAASRIGVALAARGVAVLRFDFTGLGGSEGDFANTDFSSNVADLVAAADHLRRHWQAPRLLIGHSLGGAAVLAAAARLPEVTAVATINAPTAPAHVVRLFQDSAEDIVAAGKATVAIGGRPFTIRREFLDDIDEHKLEDSVRRMHKALLLFHAPRDEVVSIDNATRLFKAALHPKSFVSLDDADHLLTRRADAEYVADVIAAWASRYLGAESHPQPELTTTPLEDGVVVVSETGDGTLAQTVTVGRHVLHADEPVHLGGTDTGPAPYDYLLASLGACTAMTLRMYADQKKLPLERVSVRLRHRKIHAADCADCETRAGRLDHIERAIELTGPLDAATRARLAEIADRCPVHRTLHGDIHIDTQVTGSPT